MNNEKNRIGNITDRNIYWYVSEFSGVKSLRGKTYVFLMNSISRVFGIKLRAYPITAINGTVTTSAKKL